VRKQTVAMIEKRGLRKLRNGLMSACGVLTVGELRDAMLSMESPGAGVEYAVALPKGMKLEEV